MLCTSGFMYDVMLSHNGANGPESNATRVSSSLLGGGTGGRSCCLRLQACFISLILTSLQTGRIVWTNIESVVADTIYSDCCAVTPTAQYRI